MITSKQRAQLRSMANTLMPIFQIGKGGLNENTINSISEALETRELVKITVLETADISLRVTAAAIAEKTGSEQVQCIGRKIVLYRKSKEHRHIEI